MRWSRSSVGRGLATLHDAVPHRFPFRLVDRIESDGSGGGRASLYLSANGFYVRGGTGWPVALVAEALAQAVALLHGCHDVGQVRLVGLHGVRLLQAVSSGDRLQVDFREEARLGGLRRFSCRALRAGAPVMEATISVAG